MRTVTSAILGVLFAAAAVVAAGGARRSDRFAALMILMVSAAGPAAAILRVVLHGIVDRLNRARGSRDLLRRVAASALELLAFLVLGWIVLGLLALVIHPVLAVPALAGGTGLALGCLVGAGRRCRKPRARPIAISRTGPPFFDTLPRGQA